jgi:hypothetical protein
MSTINTMLEENNQKSYSADEMLIKIIRDTLEDTNEKIYAFIQDHKDHGLTVELNYKEDETFVIIKIYYDKMMNCVILDNYCRMHKEKKAIHTQFAMKNGSNYGDEIYQPKKDDFSTYTNLFKGRVLYNDKFCDMVNLFLLRSKSINGNNM